MRIIGVTLRVFQRGNVAERVEVLQFPLIDAGVELRPLCGRGVLLDYLLRLSQALRLGKVLEVLELRLGIPNLLLELVHVDDTPVLSDAHHLLIISPLLLQMDLHLHFCGCLLLRLTLSLLAGKLLANL